MTNVVLSLNRPFGGIFSVCPHFTLYNYNLTFILLICHILYYKPWNKLQALTQIQQFFPTHNPNGKLFPITNLYLTLRAKVGGDVDPKDPKLLKSLNALKFLFKSGWNVFDFSYNDFKNKFSQKCWNILDGYPHFGPLKCGVSKNDNSSTLYDPTFYCRFLFY